MERSEGGARPFKLFIVLLAQLRVPTTADCFCFRPTNDTIVLELGLSDEIEYI